MIGLESELARLEARLITEPGNKATVERRIKDVKAALAVAARSSQPPVVETATVMEVETATLATKPRKPTT